jgi:hypothetical protein
VPWLRFCRKRDTRPDHPASHEPITTDWVEPTIRYRPFVRLTSFGGEGRAVDAQCDHVVGLTRSRLRPEVVGRALSLPGKIARLASSPTRCERIPEGIRAHRRNTMARNELTRPYGKILAGGAGSELPTTGLPRVVCEAFYADSNIEMVTVMKTPDAARGAREAVTVVSDPCVGPYIGNGGYSWAQTAPALA